MKRKLTRLEVAADQQVMLRGGGGQPRPGMPALSLEPCPAERTLRPPLACQGDAEVPRDAQHVALAAVFEELPQLGAAAVDLSPQKKSNRMPSASASVEMSMASCPLVRKTRFSGRPTTTDATASSMWAAGIHCRAQISVCPLRLHGHISGCSNEPTAGP